MTQTDIITQLEKHKDRAIYAAGAFADKDWKQEAHEAVKILVKSRRAFTGDDVWRLLEHTGLKTSEPRALGAVIHGFAREGLIVPTGNYVKSMRKESHRRPLQEWIAS